MDNGNETSRGRARPLALGTRWLVLAAVIAVVSTAVALLQPLYPRPEISWSERPLLAQLFYPLEVNSPLRLKASPSSLTSLAMARDGRHGIAVGNGGSILVTSDGGLNWTARDSGVTVDLGSVSCDENCGLVRVIGDGATQLNSGDGGMHWVRQDIPVDKRTQLIDLTFRGRLGWIVGSKGTILATDDNGISWHRQAAPTTSNLWTVYFAADGRHGWVGGYNVLLATADGGTTWREQPIPQVGDLNAIVFAADAQHGWAVGSANDFIATSDGGKHWRGHPDPDSDPTPHENNTFTTAAISSDGRRGWIARDDGAIFRTDDGGESWTKVSEAMSIIWKIQLDAEGMKGWAAGGGSILTSDDGGITWLRRVSGSASTLVSLRFDPSGQWGWAVGGAGLILQTSDGGATWISRSDPVIKPHLLTAVDFTPDGQKGWAVGTKGVVLATTDGGSTWHVQDSNGEAYFYDVAISNDGLHGWAAGADFLRTEDGGLTWHSGKPLATPSVLTSVAADPVGRNVWTAGTDGTMYFSGDGGHTWSQQTTPAEFQLNSIWFDTAGRRGWAVGISGAACETEDGGNHWILRDLGHITTFKTVTFTPDGRRGWVAGTDGSILTTDDFGETWTATDTKVGSARFALAMPAFGKTGWAAGYPPALLKTTDRGKTWQPVPWPLSAQSYPAVWYYLALLVALVFLLRGARRVAPPRSLGVQSIGITDAPIGDFALDRLNFGPLARGISRFLRNARTQPPLTVAITGDWGSGKSTLMELVCTDLRRFGNRPVWFNAWHHQTEEHLLAALLNAIRDSGLPPVGSTDGLAFRARLLWIRSRKYLATATFAAVAAFALIALPLAFDLSAWTNLWHLLGQVWRCAGALSGGRGCAASSATVQSLSEASIAVAQLLGGVTTIFALVHGLRAFTLDPAILLSGMAEKFRIKDATAQTSFRSRFAEQFREVTEALPYTLVIVIDDLDRCQPETVLTVMESVNFLTSSGKCFVIFGMATERVLASLALMFEKVAAEMVELDTKLPANATLEDKVRADRDRRHVYAQNYLEKLVNIEIVVPERSDIPAHLLVDTAHVRSSNGRRRSIEEVWEYWPTLLAAGTLILGLVFAIWSHAEALRQPAPKIQAAQIADTPAAVGSRLSFSSESNSAPDVVPAAPPPSPPVHRYVPVMQSNSEWHMDGWVASIIVGILFALAAGLLHVRLRAAQGRVEDTAEYHAALQIWMPVVQTLRPTPRGIKRFANRLRYLAMLQQDDAAGDSGFERLWMHLDRWTRAALSAPSSRPFRRLLNLSDSAPRTSAVPARGLSEAVLVALAALDEVGQADWPGDRGTVAAQGEGLQVAIESAVDACRKIETLPGVAGGTFWPPLASDHESFQLLLKGVKLGGAEI